MFECKNTDYYTGFEGEPEILFKIQANEKTFEFKMWIGYFNSILDNVKFPNPETNRFLSLYYLQEGWYDESPFEIEDVNEVIHVFNTFDIDKLSKDEKTQINSMISTLEEINNELISFLEFSLNNNYTVTISYS